ncbi:MAG TPA: type VI secretion system accessory protein TagJ [Caulobacteraceae bacterium]|jgi:type VI secretion system protein ImpE|nr:type VI secretion system accessory protein TagJ [Caulobacteraceae bacterium]
MADADELLRAGDLEGARASLVEAVKKAPQDQQARMFLFQLLCVGGEWDKAQIQLRSLAQLSPEAQMLSVAYGQAIEAEKYRAQVFAGSASPALLVSSSAWAGDLTGSLAALCQGRIEDAEALRDKAFEAAPETPGEFNGAAFDWVADGDARFGPSFEAIIAGQWGLVPFDAVEKVESEGPQDLRDIIWLPAQVFFKTGQSVAALLPARYPGSETSADAELRLGRGTDWVEQPWGQAGAGQHEWSFSEGEDAGLLSLRRLAFR